MAGFPPSNPDVPLPVRVYAHDPRPEMGVGAEHVSFGGTAGSSMISMPVTPLVPIIPPTWINTGSLAGNVTLVHEPRTHPAAE